MYARPVLRAQYLEHLLEGSALEAERGRVNALEEYDAEDERQDEERDIPERGVLYPHVLLYNLLEGQVSNRPRVIFLELHLHVLGEFGLLHHHEHEGGAQEK